jgi:chromosome segregation ATPase
MGLFGKKVDRDTLISLGLADAEAAAATALKPENEVKTGNEKVDIELTKVYAQLEGFAELRKANSERFSRLSEQLGEVRGMIVDTNKAMSKVEVAATKAVDLVESVHPEKLMIEVRKQDSKVEALRANIESSEAILKDLMGEIKRVREQMNFYKGTEQVVQLNEEVKQELASIKKMEAVVGRHADKVETIFLEVEKKFVVFDKLGSIVKDLQEELKKMEGDSDKMRVKLEQKEEKKEFVTLMDKFNDFEKHTTNLLKLLDERAKTMREGLERDFSRLKERLEKRLKTGYIDLDATPIVMTQQTQSTAGADVAGGDSREKGVRGLFKRKIIEKTLEEKKE